MTSPSPQKGHDPDRPEEDTRDPASRGHDGGPVGRMNTAGTDKRDDGTLGRTWRWIIIAVVVVLVVLLAWWLMN